MKFWLAGLLLLTGCSLSPDSTPKARNPRMQLVSDERVEDDQRIFHFYTFRDRETGAEVMCMRNDSCWLTGRTLK